MRRLAARPADRAALEEWLAAHGTLHHAAAAHPDARVLHGRGTVYVVPRPGSPAGGRWVVRHYRRGGSVARLLGDRYLRLGRPRPLREFAVTRALETIGVPAPRAVGAAVYFRGAFYSGDLVTEYLPDTADLAAVLFRAPDPDGRPTDPVGGVGPVAGHGPVAGRGPAGGLDPVEAMGAAGRLLRLLHQRGVAHPDLNLKNVLVRAAGTGAEALVVDLDRARILGRVSGRARRRMIRRFWRSAGKWERATGVRLDPSLRAAFEAAYARDPEGRALT